MKLVNGKLIDDQGRIRWIPNGWVGILKPGEKLEDLEK